MSTPATDNLAWTFSGGWHTVSGQFNQRTIQIRQGVFGCRPSRHVTVAVAVALTQATKMTLARPIPGAFRSSFGERLLSPNLILCAASPSPCNTWTSKEGPRPPGARRSARNTRPKPVSRAAAKCDLFVGAAGASHAPFRWFRTRP